MPSKRPSLRDRTAPARGAEAIYASPEPATVDRPPSTVDGEGAAWEENHKRVTFYCPVDVLDAVEASMRETGRSKTRVIVDALRQHLGS